MKSYIVSQKEKLKSKKGLRKWYTPSAFGLFFYFLLFTFSFSLHAQQTEKIYLSGTGSDNTIPWQFYCTGGMNANKWTTIAVPSCWELQGFGKYDYGYARDSVRGKEKGLYKKTFNVPAAWKGKVINIVFEGVMTDAEVKVNGKTAGPVHQGAFYAFKYDISQLLKYGKSNLLEVTVSKHSANASVNTAERKADFWIFGGIFRPVWLEVLPLTHIRQIGINASADGQFDAGLSLSAEVDEAKLSIYTSAGDLFAQESASNYDFDFAHFNFTKTLAPDQLWSSENPVLFKAVFSIYKAGKLIQSTEQKFGFSTVEVKQRDGIYVNGVKIKFKGVNRHSFRPETGRTMSYANSVEDVKLIKSMNMNAVRMSHYPPDDHFLDVCDSLGLFVIDELTGWQGNYDTPTGSKLVKELVEHDRNHPSIVIWANGNEGGHNTDLDTLFKEYDPQQRPVIHPWELFSGIQTQHYRQYNYGIGSYDYGREILMPTEFLHGWFDGGHGAGLEDYWEKMWHNPLGAGGFLWDFADNAVMRHDLNDSLDTDKFRAADGILGPHLEKEGSYYAIKEIWSPVHFERKEMTPLFDGRLWLENRYHFTNTNTCRFSWKLKRFEINSAAEKNGTANAPDIQPGAKGFVQLGLPADWYEYDVLYVTVTDQFNQELFAWSFPISSPSRTGARMIVKEGNTKILQRMADTTLLLYSVKDVDLAFNSFTGQLASVSNKKGALPFNNGPVIQEGANNFKKISTRREGNTVIIESAFDRKESYNTLKWTIYPSGWLKLDVAYFPGAFYTNFSGINFSLPEKEIRSVTYMGDGPYRVWKNRLRGNQFGVWSKTYNNTETGESPWVYPEFKGYHSRFYGGYFFTASNRFTVVSDTEDLFLRLYTPAWKTDQWNNYEPHFPSGDISFMQGIPAIGTKNQRNETTGPMGYKNIYYDYEKEPSRALHITVWFNFSAE
jgi:Glycosyl hydrolases family 2, TIM barrel domain/Glycosyl hydrolases family 2, sugar binding domain/Glycosyl hydrolases family 2/Beta galactosidase small chain